MSSFKPATKLQYAEFTKEAIDKSRKLFTEYTYEKVGLITEFRVRQGNIWIVLGKDHGNYQYIDREALERLT